MSATATAVRELPIPFSGPMIRALLSGAKTQTRRVVKPLPQGACITLEDFAEKPEYYAASGWCPYGEPGSKLWVRETWASDGNGLLWWRADGEDQPKVGPWRPPRYMPRWACRLVLEVVSVRVERLNQISYADCFDEGIPRPPFPNFGSDVVNRDNARNAYRELWDSLNKARGYGWASNPFVWCVEFRRLEQP